MKFFSVNKLIEEIKKMFPSIQKIDLLFNLKQFSEDKFKNMVGPILSMKITSPDGNVMITYPEQEVKFGEPIRIKMNFPQENKNQFLICTIEAQKSYSQLGSFHKRTFSKVGPKTQQEAQRLSDIYEGMRERIGDAIELVVDGEDM